MKEAVAEVAKLHQSLNGVEERVKVIREALREQGSSSGEKQLDDVDWFDILNMFYLHVPYYFFGLFIFM